MFDAISHFIAISNRKLVELCNKQENYGQIKFQYYYFFKGYDYTKTQQKRLISNVFSKNRILIICYPSQNTIWYKKNQLAFNWLPPKCSNVIGQSCSRMIIWQLSDWLKSILEQAYVIHPVCQALNFGGNCYKTIWCANNSE